MMDFRLIAARATLAADLAECQLSIRERFTDEEIAAQPGFAEELARFPMFQAAQEAEVRRLVLGSESGMVTVSASKLKAELERLAREIWQKASRSANARAARGASGGVSIIAENVAVPGIERLADMMQQLDATLKRPVRPVYDSNGTLIGARREPLPADSPDGENARDGSAALHGRKMGKGILLNGPPTHNTNVGDITMDAIQARIVALEQRPHMKYGGVWTGGDTYALGSVVTYGGSMWHANCRTTSTPGRSEDWTLCVKHGRDAR